MPLWPITSSDNPSLDEMRSTDFPNTLTAESTSVEFPGWGRNTCFPLGDKELLLDLDKFPSPTEGL
jgi:hypothetical protein